MLENGCSGVYFMLLPMLEIMLCCYSITQARIYMGKVTGNNVAE